MPEIISLIDDDSELLDVLGAWARNRARGQGDAHDDRNRQGTAFCATTPESRKVAT
jgi:hypothetical protein